MERVENDFYKTESGVMSKLLEVEKFSGKVWECACGDGTLVRELEEWGYDVYASDLIDRGFGVGGVDFLECCDGFDGDIITNPPFKYANEFILKGLELCDRKLAILGRVALLEGQWRYENIWKMGMLKKVLVGVKRLRFLDGKPSPHAHAWFVWDKEWDGEPVVGWF